tara:strand:- start:229 stop:495 length:267 start_codon:yes stop_codon:yes gene_type:complete
MKFELKTENENFSKSLLNVFKNVLSLGLIIIFCDLSLKLGFISRNYRVEYNCTLLSVEKSKSNFKKLSRLSNLKSKQKIWDFCREFLK